MKNDPNGAVRIITASLWVVAILGAVGLGVTAFNDISK